MIDKAIDRAMGAVLTVLGLVFIAAVCLNFANVFGRYVLGRSIFGADEVQTYIMVWMAFIGAVVVTWRQAHLRMDVLVSYLPKFAQSALRLIELVLVIVTAAIVFRQSWHYAGQMASMGRRSDAAGIPMAIPHSAVAVGFALIALIGLWRLIRFSKDRRAAAREPQS
jgi:TRAP-type C4-dicarboxylate transport system permease small subunit